MKPLDAPPADNTPPPAGGVSGLSLKGRALRYLAAREHSRAELMRKLSPHAPDAQILADLLDDLQAKDLLSEERLAQSLTRLGAQRYGNARIKANLQAKGLSAELVSAAMDDIGESERSRALVLWSKKFGQVAHDPKERARQMRFLAARGFSSETIYRVIKGSDDDEMGGGL
jgi:regulatory protein